MENNTTKQISLIPTHRTAAQIYLTCLEHGSSESAKETARAELIFLGSLADQRNEYATELRELESVAGTIVDMLDEQLKIAQKIGDNNTEDELIAALTVMDKYVTE